MSSLGSSSENEELKFLDGRKKNEDATQAYDVWSWEIKEREEKVEVRLSSMK